MPGCVCFQPCLCGVPARKGTSVHGHAPDILLPPLVSYGPAGALSAAGPFPEDALIPHISSRSRRTLVLAATIGATLAFGAPGALAGTLPVAPSTAPAAKAPTSAAVPASRSATWVAGTRAYLVITAPGDNAAVRSAIEANGGTVFSNFDAIGVIVAHSAAGGFAATMRGVSGVQQVGATRTSDVPADAYNPALPPSPSQASTPAGEPVRAGAPDDRQRDDDRRLGERELRQACHVLPVVGEEEDDRRREHRAAHEGEQPVEEAAPLRRARQRLADLERAAQLAGRDAPLLGPLQNPAPRLRHGWATAQREHSSSHGDFESQGQKRWTLSGFRHWTCGMARAFSGICRHHRAIHLFQLLRGAVPGVQLHALLAGANQPRTQVFIGENLPDAARDLEHLLRVHQQRGIAKHLRQRAHI